MSPTSTAPVLSSPPASPPTTPATAVSAGAPGSGSVPLAGMRWRERHRVVAGDLATAWANDVPVLATPVLVWWAELAAMTALARHLPPGWMSVGAAHEVEHAGPSLPGAEVEVEAELVASDGRRYRFRVEATDGDRVVFRGHHERGVVERARFVSRLSRLSDLSERCEGART
jgi:fluoroacetyl-CoA thioesterase